MDTNVFAPAKPAFESPVEEQATHLPEAEAQQQEAVSLDATLADFRNQEGWRIVRATLGDKIASLSRPAIGDKPDYELIGKNYVVAQEVITHLEQIIEAVEGAYERVKQPPNK